MVISKINKLSFKLLKQSRFIFKKLKILQKVKKVNIFNKINTFQILKVWAIDFQNQIFWFFILFYLDLASFYTTCNKESIK